MTYILAMRCGVSARLSSVRSSPSVSMMERIWPSIFSRFCWLFSSLVTRGVSSPWASRAALTSKASGLKVVIIFSPTLRDCEGSSSSNPLCYGGVQGRRYRCNGRHSGCDGHLLWRHSKRPLPPRFKSTCASPHTLWPSHPVSAPITPRILEITCPSPGIFVIIPPSIIERGHDDGI